MATAKENLIAARALIDTPKKWVMRGESIITVFRDLDDGDFGRVKAALTLAAGLRFQSQIIPHLFDRSHAGVMALFDRAIAAQNQESDRG